MGFRGWPAEAIDFYEGIEADNSKTYWTANRSVYETCVLQPMLELLGELEPEFGAGKVFRPYRDVRFSADKSPYKTAIGATLELGGYVQLSAEGLAAGSGMYTMAPDQLERYRKAVAADGTGKALAKVLDAIRAAGSQAEGHEILKTAPKGYPKDHPRIELLRYKGLHSWRQWPPGPWLGKPGAKTRVVDFLRRSRPLQDWLDANVGPSLLDHEGRG
ncbi:MAG: DUF2461 domain-containing protein [Acidimicrobiales bacterium]|jgi:uncharacterized protein (TIGR02453 family)